MADVQLEHGHLRIARDFFDALLQQRLTGRQWAVLMTVLRLTWGNDTPPYQRKLARIGSRKIARMTGIDERAVRRELEILRRCKMIGRRRDGQWYLWGIRKDFDKWRCEVRTRAPMGAGALGAGVRSSADTEVRTSADTGDPHLKRTEQNIRGTNSRPKSQSKSELTHLGETIRTVIGS